MWDDVHHLALLSPDVIPCGWLGINHQLTNQPSITHGVGLPVSSLAQDWVSSPLGKDKMSDACASDCVQ